MRRMHPGEVSEGLYPMGLDPILKQGNEGAVEEEEGAVKRHYPFSPAPLGEGGGRRVWGEVKPGKKVGGKCDFMSHYPAVTIWQ